MVRFSKEEIAGKEKLLTCGRDESCQSASLQEVFKLGAFVTICPSLRCPRAMHSTATGETALTAILATLSTWDPHPV